MRRDRRHCDHKDRFGNAAFIKTTVLLNARPVGGERGQVYRKHECVYCGAENYLPED